jgi:membrane protein required for colicin V production
VEAVTASWNWLDWILAGIVVLSTVAAIVKGFVRELVSLAAVVVGLVVASFGYARAALWFEDLTKSHDVALGLGFLLLFLGIVAVGAVVSLVLRKLIKMAGVQWFDRFLGGVFGLVRGVLVNSILLLALLAFTIKVEAVRQSSLAPYVVTGSRVIALVMPQSLRAQFQLGFEKLKQALIESDKKAAK